MVISTPLGVLLAASTVTVAVVLVRQEYRALMDQIVGWDREIIETAAMSAFAAVEKARTGKIAPCDLKPALETVEKTLLAMGRGNLDLTGMEIQLHYVAHGYGELAKAIRQRYPDCGEAADQLEKRAALAKDFEADRVRIPMPNGRLRASPATLKESRV